MPWLSFPEAKKIFGEAKALQLFKDAWVNHKVWREAKPIRQLTSSEYINLSEYEHAKLFYKWISRVYPKIKMTHIWNESGMRWGKEVMIAAIKKKAQGLSSWFPDYIIYLPTSIPIKFLSSQLDGFIHIPMYLELKKALWVKWGYNGSSCSEEQKNWLNHLLSSISIITIAHWSNDAISQTTKYLDDIAKFTSVNELCLYINKNSVKKFVSF